MINTLEDNNAKPSYMAALGKMLSYSVLALLVLNVDPKIGVVLGGGGLLGGVLVAGVVLFRARLGTQETSKDRFAYKVVGHSVMAGFICLLFVAGRFVTG